MTDNVHTERVGSTSGVAPVPPAINPAAGQVRPGETNMNANIGQQEQTNVRSKVMDIRTLLKRVAAATALSKEGNEYIKTVKEQVVAKQSILLNPIKIISLNYPAESLAFVCGASAIVLVFSEVNPMQPNTPTVKISTDANASLRALTGGNVKMRNCIVVTPRDYGRADAMAAEIVNELCSCTDISLIEVTAQTFKNCEITFTTDRTVIDNFMNIYDPHGVKDRNELATAICVGSPVRYQNGIAQNPDQNVNDTQAIAVVCGYTTFHAILQQGSIKFVPVVHISRIVSIIQSESIIPLILTLIYENWICNQNWQHQFDQISAVLPNIGNLSIDKDTGGLFNVKNSGERQYIIDNFTVPPILALDIVDGRARIPGLERYSMSNWYNHVITNYNKFLSLDNTVEQINPQISPAEFMYDELVGSFMEGGQYLDTRYIDYLYTVSRHPTEVDRCKALWQILPDPRVQFQKLKEFAPSAECFYQSSCVKITPEFYIPAIQFLRRNISIHASSNAAGTIDFHQFVNSGNLIYPSINTYQGMMNSAMNVNYGFHGQKLF